MTNNKWENARVGNGKTGLCLYIRGHREKVVEIGVTFSREKRNIIEWEEKHKRGYKTNCR